MSKRGTTQNRIRELSRLPQRLNKAYLAEDYDGIGQYVLVALARSSTSAALRARIASGDFGGSRTFPVGTPVIVSSIRGQLEVLLGNLPGCGCPAGFIDCFDGRSLVNSVSPLSNLGPVDLFPTTDWEISATTSLTDYGIDNGTLFADMKPTFIPGARFAARTDLANFDFFNAQHRDYLGKFRFSDLPADPTNSIAFQVEVGSPTLEFVISGAPNIAPGTPNYSGFIRVDGGAATFKDDWEAGAWYLFRWEVNPGFGSDKISRVRLWKCGTAEPSEWDAIDPGNPGGASRLTLGMSRNFNVNNETEDIKLEMDWISVAAVE